jgi:choline kinase
MGQYFDIGVVKFAVIGFYFQFNNKFPFAYKFMHNHLPKNGNSLAQLLKASDK